jgi:sigma-B regulation protein RsbU (phosphoserine phosphatase)
MLPTGTYTAADAEICGVTRPANTVGGDFYDVLPLIDDPEQRVIITIGDVAGKGSPAALLMALLLAVLRTLVDEKLEARALVARLNTQICRHSPGSRFTDDLTVLVLKRAAFAPDASAPRA